MAGAVFVEEAEGGEGAGGGVGEELGEGAAVCYGGEGGVAEEGEGGGSGVVVSLGLLS